MDFNLYFKSRQGELIGLLKEIVQSESPTSDKKAVDACSAILISKLRALGAKVIRHPQKTVGDFYVVEYPGRADKAARERLLVLTHVDTVWPVGRIARMPFYIQGDKVFGPGVLDMKAGLVLAFSALRALREMNLRPRKKIVLFINSSEETDCAEADALIRTLAKRAAAVLCLEPALPGGALKVQRKGRLVVRLDSTGRAAHAGHPEDGINAIDELNSQLRRLGGLLRSKDVSMNVGVIGGGEKANIVADKAWALLDFRFWTSAQKAGILSICRRLSPVLKGAKTKASVEGVTPPMEKTPASNRLLESVRTIAAEIGQTLETGRAGGGSDASIAAGLGAATVDGLGPDGDGMHADQEHLLLSSLVGRAALLTELLHRL